MRTFVSGRSAPQKLGALAMLAVLVTAPFGGLSKAESTGAAPLALHHRYDIGPFFVTLDQVETLSDLAPTVSPSPGHRLLVIEVEVTNHTDRAELASLVTEAIGGEHTGAVPWPGQDTVQPEVFDVEDGGAFEGSDWVNPGQSYQLALIVQQEQGWTPGGLTLSLNGYVFERDDVTTLDPEHWVQRRYVAAGPVPVKVKP